MNQLDLNKPLFQLTAGEFLLLLKESVSEQPKQEEAQKRLVYGIAGIAQIFNCSMTTANRIKASGRIDDAITQHGRIIVVDANKALQLFNNK